MEENIKRLSDVKKHIDKDKLIAELLYLMKKESTSIKSEAKTLDSVINDYINALVEGDFEWAEMCTQNIMCEIDLIHHEHYVISKHLKEIAELQG